MTTFNYQEFLNGPASNLSEDFKTSAGRMIPRLFPKNDTPQGIKTVILSPNFKEKTILAPSLGS